MTKSRRSSQRKTSTNRHTHDAKTPTRPTDSTQPADSDDSEDEVWNFDAPQFYDFGSTKTPGPTVDKWFDYVHPTPAPKKTRKSRPSSDDIFAADSRDSLLPTRPSLSPSRLIVESDGRLTLDESQDNNASADEADGDQLAAKDVEFSDTDDEIEFNNWRSAQVLASIDNNSDHDNKDGSNSCDQARASEASTASMTSEVSLEDTEQNYKESRPALKVSTANGGGKVMKKSMRGVVPAGKSLTIPMEMGFMRPTKGATRRQQAKQRDKMNKRLISEAIAQAAHSKSASNRAGNLTVPAPFRFHERKTDRKPLPTADQNPSISKKSQPQLVSKSTAKRKLADTQGTDTNINSNSIQESNGSPPRRAIKKLKPTIPKTPQFAKAKRVRREALDTKDQETGPKPVRRLVKPALPAHFSPPKPTIVQPFTFRSDAAAERHLQKLREEISKLRQEEEAMRQFHANPLPLFPTPKKPKRQSVQLHSSPFKLSTDIRGEAYQKKLRARLDELERRQRERQEFKARPIPESIDHPFVPQASAMPLTAIEEVLLQTELRSEERRAYDEDRMERDRIREEVLARKRQEEERREEEEIKRLRKLLVHKAQPVRQYKPLVIQPSDRPLTIPKTPQWHVRTRKQPEPETTPTR
ncbi:Protein tpx2 [Coemansia brasiliensis]|uniref:Protein tpx2 n=1 Tax=Coemansia brasiliensis TaxID=2650707 RepID=A0A9W8I6Y1_9FUNG|nr:Protein tpx2 [Coemansia brasiliensis]